MTTTPTLKATKAAPQASSSLRSRRLIVKRDGTEANISPVALRDAIKTALKATSVLSIQFSWTTVEEHCGNVSITLMENLTATNLYGKVSRHLNIILGALSPPPSMSHVYKWLYTAFPQTSPSSLFKKSSSPSSLAST